MRDHLADDTVVEADTFAPGAALMHGGEAWVLLDERPTRRLGAALAWSLRAGAGALHVITESGSGVLARRAAELRMPITVWHADERALWPAVPEPSCPCRRCRRSTCVHDADRGRRGRAGRGVRGARRRGARARGLPRRRRSRHRAAATGDRHRCPRPRSVHDDPRRRSDRGVAGACGGGRRGAPPDRRAPHPFNRLARERLLRWSGHAIPR